MGRAEGIGEEVLTVPAPVPKVMSRKPPARAKFFKIPEQRAALAPAQKSPGTQNCFHSSAVTPQ